MILNITIDEKKYPVEIPETLLDEAQDFFNKMDRDMDKGWQMSREWIEQPDQVQRCQIAAHKLLAAISAENNTMVTLMVGYILSRMPGITSMVIDTNGEMQETQLFFD